MPKDRLIIGHCPKCFGDHLSCAYNHFENDEVTIDSWEHKCPDCGFRDTKAYRSDEPELELENLNPRICPYCSRRPQ